MLTPLPKKAGGGVGCVCCLSHQDTDIEHCPKAPGGPSSERRSLATRKPRGEHPTWSSRRVPLEVWRHTGWGCRPRTGETRTIFFGLSANTVVSKHLLLYLSSSHCPQAFLWNSRDYPHTLFLICVSLSLEKARRNLLHTPAKYNKTEYSSIWRGVQATCALRLISYFSLHFPSNPLHNYTSCLIFLKLSVLPKSIFKRPSLKEPGHWIKLSQLDATHAAIDGSPEMHGCSWPDRSKGCPDPVPAPVESRRGEGIDPVLLTC